MNGFTFAAPYCLWALLALPVLWWWLRLTPPQPRQEIFPPLRLLAGIAQPETQAAQSPWWLTLLRLGLAALLILAFAQPLRSGSLPPLQPAAPLAVMIDNGFAAYPLRQRQAAAARALLAAAARSRSPVYIIATAAPPDAALGPYSSAEAERLIGGLRYQPVPVRRAAAFARLAQITAKAPPRGQAAGGLQIAYLTDGLATEQDKRAFAALQNLPVAALLWFAPQNPRFIGITAAENGADSLRFTVRRGEDAPKPAAAGRIAAYDEKEQILAEQDFHFAPGAAETAGSFALPLLLRNAVAALRLEKSDDAIGSGAESGYSVNTAAGLRLMDSGNKQKLVAVLGTRQSRLSQPLLSPLYYVAKALQGAPGVAGGQVLQAEDGTMEQTIDRLPAAKLSLLIMGDTAAIPPPAVQKLRQWVEQGGTLLRFGGAALANAENNAESFTAARTLLPVPLRRGERSFGGILNWEKPQNIAPFAPNSPFYGLNPPQNVVISKQILAEPSADLYDKSWISLTDGTPLMTAAPLGKGRLIFVHTGLDGSWSNLALSGFFVDMLERIVKISGSPNAAAAFPQAKPARQSLAPYRIIGADGALTAAPDYVRPLALGGGAPPQPGYWTPPGLYGARDALYPLNLLGKDSRFSALAAPPLPQLRRLPYSSGNESALPMLLFAAACLFIADMVINLLLKTALAAQRGKGGLPKIRSAAKSLLLFCAVLSLGAGALAGGARQAAAAPLKTHAAPSAANAAAMAGKTRLAYVITGDAALDAVSKAGLQNLSRFIERRTTIAPGDAVGVNLATDELAFYPLIYWPISADSPMPAPQAIAKTDAYMHHGGTVLFDTRDALQNGLQLDDVSPAGRRLRAILAGLNLPPLEPAPKQHVIARSFYIMPDFPGRYRNSPLWIAAANADDSRPIRAGDGVSPLIITANDFAGAWADDGKGGFMFPLIPDGEEQRLWAFRGGLNIVMYILTGNYKADQVNTPELLRRLSP